MQTNITSRSQKVNLESFNDIKAYFSKYFFQEIIIYNVGISNEGLNNANFSKMFIKNVLIWK